MYDIILIPTYNERENIRGLIQDIFREVPDIHVKIIDDNSPDGTSLEVKDMINKYPNLSLLERNKKEGLGVAYIHAKSLVVKDENIRYVFTMDADGSHNPIYLPTMISALSNSDFVIGSRYIKGGGVSKWEFWRRVLSRLGNFYARILTGMPIKDITAGYTGMKRTYLEKVDFRRLSAEGYAYLMEFKYEMISNLGARSSEVPIFFMERRGGETKMSSHIVHEGLEVPIKIFLTRLEKYYLFKPFVKIIKEHFLDLPLLIRFVVSGGIAAIINLTTLYIFTEFLDVWYIFSTIIAFSVAFWTSFLLQKLWTFKDMSSNKLVGQLGLYLTIMIMNLGLNVLLIYIFVEVFKIWYMLAAVLVAALIAIESFLLYKRFVF